MTRKALGSPISSTLGKGSVSETTVRPDSGPWGLIIQSEDRTSYFPRNGRKPPRVERRLPSGGTLVDDFAAGLVLREDYIRRVDSRTLMPKGKALGDRAVLALQRAGASWFRVVRQEVYGADGQLKSRSIRLVEEFRGAERIGLTEVDHREV